MSYLQALVGDNKESIVQKEWTEDVALVYVKDRPDLFSKVPCSFKTYKVCIEAVKAIYGNIKFVPRVVFFKHVHKFLEVHRGYAKLLKKENIKELCKNVVKLTHVISTYPDILDREDVLYEIFINLYHEGLLLWVKRNFPEKWNSVISWKEEYDRKYHRDIKGNPTYQVRILGPRTQFGLRIKWRSPILYDIPYYFKPHAHADGEFVGIRRYYTLEELDLDLDLSEKGEFYPAWEFLNDDW